MVGLRIGTAGVPLSSKGRDTAEGIARVRELGLDAMELEFVRQVYVKSESSGKEICNAAKMNNVALSAHAPYFVNLNTPEKAKLEASRKRIIDCARAAHWCGAKSVVIHSAFYLGMEKEIVYERVKREYKLLMDEILNLGMGEIVLRPELMGRPTQFADIDEISKMCSELEGVLPCADFAHYQALHGERINNYDGFRGVLETVEKWLGKDALNNMHIHFSGIEYGEKGERHHLVFDEAKLKWKEMAKAWKDYKIGGIAISESPNIEDDAVTLKKYYESI